MAELEGFIKKALKVADEAEIYYEVNSDVLFRSVLDRIENCSQSVFEGWSLRVIKDGRLGFAYFTSPSGFDQALETAMHVAKFAQKLDVHFPKKQKLTRVKGLFNEELAKADEEFLSKALLETVDVVKDGYKARSVQNYVSKSVAIYEVCNSAGNHVKKRDALFEASAISQYKEARGYDFKISRKIFDPVPIAKRSAQLAELLAGGKPVKGNFEIILHPIAAMQLIGEILAPAIDGENVFSGQSPWDDKLGETVASEKISVWDDPTLAEGAVSCEADDEGLPARKKPIIERGVLKTFIYDLETAARAGKQPTGNGFRASFTHNPRIEISNLVFEPEEKQKLGEVKGILVYDLIATHNVNPATGDFAVEIGEGFTWDRGEMTGSVRECSIVGNFFDLLKKVRFGDDLQNYGWYYGPSWIYDGEIV